jgi:hypothetical protein
VLVLAHYPHGILFRNIKALRAIVLSGNPAAVRHDYAVRQWLRGEHTWYRGFRIAVVGVAIKRNNAQYALSEGSARSVSGD